MNDLFYWAITFLAGVFVRELVSGLKGYWKEKKRKELILKDLIFPLVRIADELVGRTYNHANRDFTDQRGRTKNPSDIEEPDHLYDLYLWARFWAYTSQIRKGILSYKMTESTLGLDLLRFLDCLEAVKVSIISRAEQKLIGDGFADKFGWQGESTFFGFVEAVHEDASFAKALGPINEFYAESYVRKKRQALLAYIMVIHVMTDFFDRENKLSSQRQALFNKLSKKARQDLQHRVMVKYLQLDPREASKYTGM